MDTKVSIIITTYNRADLLIEAVESCLKQTYENLEVVVVDDGSTDGTSEKMEVYQQNNKVVYHYKTNAERAAARNTGMKIATGNYFKFLDSDDLLEPNCIELCVRYFENNKDVDLVHTNCKVLHDDGSIIDSSKKGIVGNVFEDLWEWNDISLSAVMIKRFVFEKWGGFDETRSLSGAEDWEYWVRLAKQGCIVGFVSEFVTIIRTHPENGTMNDIDKILFSSKEAQNLLVNKFHIPKHLIQKLKNRHTYLKAVYFYINGNRSKSLLYIVKATKQNRKLLLKSDIWILGAKNFIPKKFTQMAKKIIKS